MTVTPLQLSLGLLLTAHKHSIDTPFTDYSTYLSIWELRLIMDNLITLLAPQRPVQQLEPFFESEICICGCMNQGYRRLLTHCTQCSGKYYLVNSSLTERIPFSYLLDTFIVKLANYWAVPLKSISIIDIENELIEFLLKS